MSWQKCFSTPLLKWYLNHGLVITQIYNVIEFIPDAAFNSFMTQVAQARLDGDGDKDKALIAETMKLIGNSSYGKHITNKEKHHMTSCTSMSPKLVQKSWMNIFAILLNFLTAITKNKKLKRKFTLTFLFILVSSF